MKYCESKMHLLKYFFFWILIAVSRQLPLLTQQIGAVPGSMAQKGPRFQIKISHYILDC